jgi:membrane associated rhomboid family serine protease
MLLPLSHDNATSRRWPVVTLAFLAVCLLVHVIVSMTGRAQEAAAREALRRAGQHVQDHPGLEIPALTGPDRRPLPPDVVLRGIPAARPELADPERRQQQETLDAMIRDAVNVYASGPVHRFGYIPDRGGVLTLVTYAFLHGGWLHLIFNAWFLWLCGCNMEDRWGRPFYAGFYVAAGAVAALAHHVIAGGRVPLIGASGAVAGAMGAFLVVHARARIRFMAWLFLRPFFFTAPAFVILPLWLGSELLEAKLGVQDGVAHVAHIGGFAFGLVVALAVRWTGLENKLDDAVERAVTVAQDPRLASAGALTDAGRAGEALTILEDLAAEQPAQIDVQLETLRAAKAAGDARREIRAYGRLIDLYVKAELPGTAVDLYLEVKQIGREHEIPPNDRLFAADRLARKGRLDDAAILYTGLYERGIQDATALRALVGHARVAAQLGRAAEARGLLAQVRGSPFSTPEIDALAGRELARLG